ncbi:MAG: hypothetical protein JWP65_3527 [Ramlibacter sp.]|uniref:hypothetical protein n=1 Tax=Ramlibacter sp. TaxID=1917967 RepID=UPI00262D1AA5|nr:hypothetical protein [Ramlibacter sp.]MDB5753106.1 hypothetical protein [Ramlibacter sp.]
MISLGHLLVLALQRGAPARDDRRARVLELLTLYETEFDAMCGGVAAGSAFVAFRDRISPLHAAYADLLPREPEPMREVLDAHCAVLAQLFALSDVLAGADASGPMLVLEQLRSSHSAAVRGVRERVQRLGAAGAARR